MPVRTAFAKAGANIVLNTELANPLKEITSLKNLHY